MRRTIDTLSRPHHRAAYEDRRPKTRLDQLEDECDALLERMYQAVLGDHPVSDEEYARLRAEFKVRSTEVKKILGVSK